MNNSTNRLKVLIERTRKHWGWRIMVGIMALIGVVTTITSLYKDVLKPLCFPEKELKRQIELVNLIRLFMPDANGNGPDWAIGAEADSPIQWETDERYGDVPDIGFETRFGSARHGTTTVLIDGKPSHEQFDKCIHPATWEISLYGCMASVECIEIESGGSGYNEIPDIIGKLSQYAELRDKHPDNGATFSGTLYRLKLPGRGEGWLVESWSIGNHSWSFQLVLFPGPDSYGLAKEFLDGLLRFGGEVRGTHTELPAPTPPSS